MTETSSIVLMQAQSLPEIAGGEVPDWIKILPPPGQPIATHDARGPYAYADPQAVIAASLGRKPRIVVDENHATETAAKRGEPSPARGYVAELQARADGIWARIDWTAAGRALMADRAYWGISPVFMVPKSAPRVIAAIKSIALTNEPNLRELPALHHEETGMSHTALAQALGLAETATEDEMLARASALTGAETAHAALQAQMGEIGRALGVEGADPGAVLIAARQAAEADDADTVAALQTEVASLTGRVASLTEAAARSRAETFVDAEIARGRMIPASLRDHYVSRHMQDAASVETEIAAFGILKPGLTPAPQAQTAAGPRTAPEIAAAAQTLVAQAQAEGRKLDYLTAVQMVTKG